MNHYEVAVIGSGPGGYVSAIRCAQLGMKTVLIERYPTLGGTCLNVGCIPSKALLDSSEHFYNASTHFETHGIDVSDLQLNWANMQKRKTEVVSQTCSGVEYLMKKNGIEIFRGHGSFEEANKLIVNETGGGKKEVVTNNVIIATGSKPSSIPGVAIDKQRIISSTEALKLDEIPKELVVIGGGIIGLELGSVYARLGAKVDRKSVV